MSIPTHNLYDFIHQSLERRYWLIYFYPWGSKNLLNAISYQKTMPQMASYHGIAKEWRVWEKIFPHLNPASPGPGALGILQPTVFCHDQEPLDFDLYSDHSLLAKHQIDKNQQEQRPFYPDLNLRNAWPDSLQRRWILLHSELNSPELERYENTGRYAGAYWWSHAIIARDWYRFAKHDQSLTHQHPTSHLFLAYCRDTTGSRGYRADFLQLINDKNIKHHCKLTDPNDNIPPTASAEYDYLDFVSTRFSIVLETIFENQRIHLTEKILRPIACGHPFILAAGPGSLQYLKRYGFKTFSPFIDESYDLISDPAARLNAITNEMHRIATLDPEQLNYVVGECQQIAQHNRAVFFSDQFTEQVIQELKANVFSINLNDQMFVPEFEKIYTKLYPPNAGYVREFAEKIKQLNPGPGQNLYCGLERSEWLDDRKTYLAHPSIFRTGD